MHITGTSQINLNPSVPGVEYLHSTDETVAQHQILSVADAERRGIGLNDVGQLRKTYMKLLTGTIIS